MCVGLLPLRAHAHVTRIDIRSRADYANGRAFGLAGAYEEITGTVHFAVDPKNPHNQVIVDLDKAPRNAKGLVEFQSDLHVIKPKDANRSNGTILFEVSNRGGRGMVGFFNRGGDDFLFRHGFTLAWAGWQFDAPAGLRLSAPVATDNGKPIVGLVRSEFIPSSQEFEHSLSDRNHKPYRVINPDNPEYALTVRETRLGTRRVIPRGDWQFVEASRISMRSGFQPGKIYEIVYRSQDPVVVGCGPTAVRDFISHLKHDKNPIVSAHHAIGFGVSQSGRFLRHFMYQGFNADEQDHKVFDGVMSHVAGGGRGSFNHRFAQPSRDGHPFMNMFYPTDLFPFTDVAQTDPVTGGTDGLLAHMPANTMPKVFYTNSSYEYWGRAASLIHATVDGKSDAPLMDNVRIYLFAGGQHGPGGFPPSSSGTRYLQNPNDFVWSMRALLLAMERWAREGTSPPPSRFPRMSDGTLVPLSGMRWPKIPGIAPPQSLHEAYRIDYGPQWKQGIVGMEPPRIIQAFPMLVPQVDRDGNELAGIRMPEIAVPLATHTGWNYRSEKIGAPNELSDMRGTYIALARTRAERERVGDPRLSIEERYPSRSHYLGEFAESAVRLVKDGYLLSEDIPVLLNRAATHWDHATKRE